MNEDILDDRGIRLKQLGERKRKKGEQRKVKKRKEEGRLKIGSNDNTNVYFMNESTCLGIPSYRR